MKLKKVCVNKYKNLENCTIDFAQCNNLAVVAGLNGSGKSNFLEALSLIVLDLNRRNKAANAVWPTYRIEYEIGGKSYVAAREAADQEHVNWIQPDADSGCEPKAIQRVIAMYSGQFCRLDVLGDSLSGGGSSQSVQMVAGDNLSIALLALNLAQKDSRVETITYSIDPPLSDESRPEDDRQFAILKALSNIEASNDGLMRAELSAVSAAFRAAGVLPTCAEAYSVLNELLGDEGGGVSKIVDLKVNLNEGGTRICLEDLSEGEKRRILLDFLFEALADSESLVLLDEPDAHIHEDRKLELFDLLQDFAQRGITTIFTSHSPVLIEHVEAKHLIAFHAEDGGRIEVHQGDDFDTIADLTGSRLSFFSTRPLMLFEGKSDINILANAMAALRRLYPKKYDTISLERKYDLYFMGGANMAKDAVDLFRSKFSKRGIVVVLDGDEAGRKSFKALINHYAVPAAAITDSPTDRSRQAVINANTKVVIPPAPRGVSGDYGVEDYFKKSFLDSIVINYLKCSKYQSFLTMPKIKQDLKNELGEKKIASNPADGEFSNFDGIIDFLLKL